MNKNRDITEILDVAPMGVYPPRGGGSLRIHNLNLFLSKKHNIFLFSQGLRRNEFNFPLRSWITHINENYAEYRHVDFLTLISSSVLSKRGIPNIFFDEILKILKPSIIRKKITECDVIKVEHPWQFKHLYETKPRNKPIILDSHNVEIELITQTYHGFFSKKIARIVNKKEYFAVTHADAIFVTSREDKEKIHKIYNIPKSKIYEIPNGTDISKFDFRRESRTEKKVKKEKIILFVGANHPPNIEAVKEIIKMREKIWEKNILFLVVGRCGEKFRYTHYKNINFTGYVKDVKKYFRLADIAINPMLSGSGTNIKMLEYFASGIPTITTPMGARGIEIVNGKHAIVSDLENFPYHITELLNNEDLRRKLGENARKLAEEKYDWKKIAERANRIIERIAE